MLKNRHNLNYNRVKNHAPKVHDMNEDQWGWFLAGLIDGDGHFNKLGYLTLVFDAHSVNTAYEIKRFIGYGTVSRVPYKNAYTYVLSHRQGRLRVAELVKHKLRHKNKRDQYNIRFVNKLNLPHTSYDKAIKVSFENHWLAGFIQSDGSFQIKALTRANRKTTEFRLVLQIDQKYRYLLDEIKSCFGGYVGYRASQDTYYYSSVSFKNAVCLIYYLDVYCVRGCKNTCYKLWRRCYIIIQSQAHLSPRGASVIYARKLKLSRLYASRLSLTKK